MIRREIVVDKEGKTLLIYSQEDIICLRNSLNKIPNISRVYEHEHISEYGTSTYFEFCLNKTDYTIRVSDHTRERISGSTVYGVYWMDDEWKIDVAVGRYKVKDVILLIKEIDSKTTKYSNPENYNRIKAYAKQHIKNLGKHIFDEADILSLKVTASYVLDNKIKDDKYGTDYISLDHLIYPIVKRQLKELKKKNLGTK